MFDVAKTSLSVRDTGMAMEAVVKVSCAAAACAKRKTAFEKCSVRFKDTPIPSGKSEFVAVEGRTAGRMLNCARP